MSRMWAIALVLAVPGAARAAGFDCAKAASAVEHRICGNPALSGQDEALRDAYAQAVAAFDPGAAGTDAVVADLKAAQQRWLELRNKCADDACLGAAYARQIAVLQFRPRPGGTSAADRWAGKYNHGGFLDMLVQVRDDHSVRLAIAGAEPKSGAWTCALAGIATVDGETLHESAPALTATSGAGSVTIAPGSANDAASHAACGLNGSLEGSYAAAPTK